MLCARQELMMIKAAAANRKIFLS